jgi:hypothetical protein
MGLLPLLFIELLEYNELAQIIEKTILEAAMAFAEQYPATTKICITSHQDTHLQTDINFLHHAVHSKES